MVELVEGEVLQYREVNLGFTEDDMRFAMGMAAADSECEDIEAQLITLSTHHSFVTVFMASLRESLGKQQ